MKIEELITFCTLQGTLDLHEPQKHNPDCHQVRMLFPDKIITFGYYKDPHSSELTFLTGRISLKDGSLGTLGKDLWGFKHLMKELE